MAMTSNLFITLCLIGSFFVGFIFGGLVLFLGAYLGSKFKETGSLVLPQGYDEFSPHELNEDYFNRALQTPEDGGLEFPADFSDESLDEIAERMEKETGASGATELREMQMRGF